MDANPMHAMMTLITTPWGWLKGLSDTWKRIVIIATAVGAGVPIGGGLNIFRADRARFVAGAERADTVQANLSAHIRNDSLFRVASTERISSLERSFDVLLIVRDRQRSDSARLDRIECYIEAIAAQLGPSSLTACGVRGRRQP